MTDRQMMFGSLAIDYNDQVLKPRPWTTAQSHWAAELLRTAPNGPVLELCAGAGHIGLLAVAGSDRHLTMVDDDPTACRLAARNAQALGRSEQVQVCHAAIDSAATCLDRFALIIADPPWVPTEATSGLPEDPLHAIDGGVEGLGIAQECLRAAEHHLLPGGSLLLQLGTLAQAAEIRRLCEVSGVLNYVETRDFEPDGVLMRLALAP